MTGDGKNIYQAMVRAPDPRTRVETILLNGKPLLERTYALSEGGRSMTTAVREPGGGKSFSTISHRK